MDNSFVLSGNIDTKSLFNLRETLNSSTKDLQILINSTGGDLDCAFAMLDLINSSPYRVTTTAIGKCCSAAVVVFLAGEIRQIYPNSSLLMHEPYLMFSEDTRYNLNNILFEYEKLNWSNKRLINLFENKTLLKEKDIKKFFSSGETLLTAQDCLKYGIATNIL